MQANRHAAITAETLGDTLVADAADRLFAELSPAALAAGAAGRPDEALHDAVREAGFADALPTLDDRDGWIAAASILRAQGRHAAPIDMAEELLARAVGAEPDDAAAEPRSDARRRHAFALARCLQVAGAMSAALALSVRYVGERRQFGRPLAAFQAIQHQLAVAAEHSAAATVATDLALVAVCTEGLDSDRAAALIDVAVLVNGEAIASVYDCAHQVHGAIGFTREYALHHHTLNLVRWRDEIAAAAGGELRCAERLGAAVVREAGLWRTVTDLARLAPKETP